MNTEIIPIKFVIDRAVDTLMKRGPNANMRFKFTDKSVSLPPSEWKIKPLQQKVMLKFIHAITREEVKLRDDYGMPVINKPDPFCARDFEHYAVSRDDAEKLLELCAISPGLLFSNDEAIAPAAKVEDVPVTTTTAQGEQDAPAAKGESVPVATPAPVATPSVKIPGKMSRITIGKLAIKAAWQIEQATRKRATARQVIDTLQSWVDHKDNPDAVTELTHKIPNGVTWVTTKSRANNYDIGACEKTLATWNESRE